MDQRVTVVAVVAALVGWLFNSLWGELGARSDRAQSRTELEFSQQQTLRAEMFKILVEKNIRQDELLNQMHRDIGRIEGRLDAR